jgi:hypothetical protein
MSGSTDHPKINHLIEQSLIRKKFLLVVVLSCTIIIPLLSNQQRYNVNDNEARKLHNVIL